MRLTTFIAGALALLTAVGSFALQAAEAKAAVTNAPVAPAAKLAPMDKLQYRVQEDPAQGSRVVAVSSLGKIDFPVSISFDNVIVTVEAKGLTMDEVAVALKKELEARYYKTATISLSLVDKVQKMGQVLFSGECKGSIPLPPNEDVTLSSALIKLGYSEFADLKRVRIDRIDKLTGKKTDPLIYNMESVIKKGERGKDKDGKDKDPLLQDDDRVFVPEKKIVGFGF